MQRVPFVVYFAYVSIIDPLIFAAGPGGNGGRCFFFFFLGTLKFHTKYI